jgi:hypothetical protein
VFTEVLVLIIICDRESVKDSYCSFASLVLLHIKKLYCRGSATALSSCKMK